jgi:Predicted membrane protein
MSEKHNSKNACLDKLSNYYLPTLLIVGLILILNLAKANPMVGPSKIIPHEETFQLVVGYAVLFCEISAVLIIASASVQALIGYTRRIMDRNFYNQIQHSESLRLRLGHRLSLGLEFAVAADILRLAISPTLVDIMILFAIILLRILLNYFLEHDIQIIREYDLLPEPTSTDQKDEDKK